MIMNGKDAWLATFLITMDPATTSLMFCAVHSDSWVQYVDSYGFLIRIFLIAGFLITHAAY